MAGLRTNALLATGAALFALLSAYAFTTLGPGGVRAGDPTRVAAQIVSGIGFLGAGVILRDGVNLRGLNTAATLWRSAGIGALAGAGMYPIAAVGTVAVVAANVVLRPLGRGIDRHPSGGGEVAVDYTFEAVCADRAEAHIRALLVGALTGNAFTLRAVHSRNTTSPRPAHTGAEPAGGDGVGLSGGLVTVAAELSAEHRDDRQLEHAVSRLSLEPAVTAVTWRVAAVAASPGSPAAPDDAAPPGAGRWRRSPLLRDRR